MANIKSAKKRAVISERNRVRNHAYKSSIRTAIKRVHEILAKKAEATEVQTSVAKAYSLIDRAILKGILHKNTGSRYKARLLNAVNKQAA